MATKKLFLLDAFALIYRAHFALSKNPRVNSKGQNTGAILGFMNSLLEVYNKEDTTHIGVAFDTAAPTFRKEEYSEYKAQRDEQPEDISFAIPYIKAILKAFNIPILEKDGFEADDVIGTLAHKAADEGFEVYMVTPDKDYGQLVTDKVFLYKPSYMGNAVDIMDVAAVNKKWDISHPDQVRDILGLQGDASDNIPGIPGIGAKTAAKLIKTYGSVEELVKNTADLKGKQKEKVEEFAEQGILSKRLATIIMDVPVPFDSKQLEICEPNKEAVIELFDELEFRALKKRVFGEETPEKGNPSNGQTNLFDTYEGSPQEQEESDKATLETTKHDYQLIDTKEKRAKLIAELEKLDEFCFDAETTSLNALKAKIIGLAFSREKGKALYVPFPKDQKATQEQLDEFKPLMANKKITKIGQNLKYDILVLHKYGVEVRGPIFDTMIAHYLLQPEMRHNMDFLAESYLNYSPVSIETLIGKKGKNQGNMADVPVDQLVEYAGEDADITYQLKEYFAPELKKEGLFKLLTEVEGPLVNVLARMEVTGVKVDVDTLRTYSKQLEKESLEIEKEIYDMAGVQFNIGSPKQLGEVLFDHMKLEEKPKKTKSGQYATGEEILSKLAPKHAIADKILSYRELNKLKSTYVDALPRLIHSDGRIHTSYQQTVAATGRLSSVNPNLQNIPIRTDRGKEIRRAFIKGGEDYTFFAADYSQIELRIMAAFSQDENMIAAFKNGQDIHATTASKVFGVELDDVSADMRRQAKMVNFGIIYGISAYGLSQRLGIARKEAADIIEAYFTKFPAVKQYMDEVVEKARKQEYVETLLGRRRYLRDINSRNATNRGFAERNAINAPIQGSAADMIKIAMIRIDEWLRKEQMKTKMILQVHDELIFDVHIDELEEVSKQVTDFMKYAMELPVPMEIGIGYGDNWLVAH